jgi:hypothetical protein
MHMSMSYLRFHYWLRWAFGPFSGRIHRLTSPKVRTFHVFSTVRTRRSLHPFELGIPAYAALSALLLGGIRVFPSSHTLCSIPLPYGRDTTYVR